MANIWTKNWFTIYSTIQQLTAPPVLVKSKNCTFEFQLKSISTSLAASLHLRQNGGCKDAHWSHLLPKFSQISTLSPSILENCEIIFKFLKNCKDALEMPSAPKVLTNSRKSQDAAADDLYQGSNNHQVQYRDDTDLHLKGWSIDHFGEELIQKWPFFINQQ